MRSIWTYLILGVVVLAGLVLRTWNVNFDGGLNAHPDERSNICFFAPTLGWPSSFDEFLDPELSPLNPLKYRESDFRSYAYGHFPLYLGIITGELLSQLARPAGLLPLPDGIISRMELGNTPCQGMALAGRLLMALLDTLTIFLLFLLGRRLYGAAAGLLAATFYAFTAQAIQLSHFFAMDPSSTTFVVLTVYGGVLMVQERSWRGVLFAGVGAGLAISAKFSALPILAVPVVAALVVQWRSNRRPLCANESERDDRSHPRGMLVGAPVALLLALASFVVTSPYAVLDWASFIQATLDEQGLMVRGIVDLPYTRRYRNTTPYLYFIQQQVVWGMGLPLGLIAAAGSVWALAKVILLRAKPGELVVWVWLVPYFGITGLFLAKFNRYMSPALPFVLLFAAGLIAWLWKRGFRKGERGGMLSLSSPLTLLSLFLTLCSVGGGLFWSLSYVNGVYAHEHTWIAASRWVYANAPAGSAILWELWDDPLPKSIPGEQGMDIGTHGLRHISWGPFEEDTPAKYALFKQKLREADYVIYSSNRIYDSVDELPERYPMTILYYELMFDEQLGFVRTSDITSPPRLWGLAFPDHDADESWTLYDHPRVSIFAKQRELSDAEFDTLLGGTWEGAIPQYRGRVSPLNSVLTFLQSVISLFGSQFSANHDSPQQGAVVERADPESQNSETESYCDPLSGGGAVCYCGSGPVAEDWTSLFNSFREGQPKPLGDPASPLVSLLGWELMEGEESQPTDTVRMRLVWQPHRHNDQELHSFVQLYTPSIEHSWAGAQNYYPGCHSAMNWQTGNFYVDDLLFNIPDDTPPVSYSLVAGLVSSDGEKLAVPGSQDGLLHLGNLDVAPLPTGFFERKRFLRQELPATLALADTNDGLRLLGYDLLPAPGAPTLRLYWETTGHVDNDWITYIHLHDPDGERLAQFDGPPLTGLKPTSSWQVDALYIDRRQLILPAELEPDTYLIRLGLYSPSSGERLPFQPEFSDVQGQFEGGQLLVPLSLSGETENGPDY